MLKKEEQEGREENSQRLITGCRTED